MSNYDSAKLIKSFKENTGEYLLGEAMEKIYRLQRELNNCRNELCLKCGNYRESHNGACDGCRYRRDGEWRDDLYE
jgi:hypothetical protein